MRLLMFRQGDERRLGVLREGSQNEVIDLVELSRADGSAPPDLLALIDQGPAGLQRVRQLVSSSKAIGSGAIRRLEDVTVLAPLDPPRGNVLAIGRNYQKHAEEGARAWKEEVQPPTVFTKAQTSVAGPYEDIPINPAVSEQIDWEVELGVVIGKPGANIQAEAAMNHVWGYTVVNDVSARDIQYGWGKQYFKGKSLDKYCPMGPWIVTADEIPDPQSLRLTLKVNGVVKQDGNTQDMIYPVRQLIVWLSIGMTLLPGNVIATGTPDGVGFARTPPEFLKPGDVMETEVEGVGLLRNKIVSAAVPVAR